MLQLAIMPRSNSAPSSNVVMLEWLSKLGDIS